ncbi:hypothetical protein LCGC14_3014910, partial [marine sediment metagenome]
YINGDVVVSGGVPLFNNISFTGSLNNYLFTYSNTAGFDYGDRVIVRVVADDLAPTGVNSLDTTYYYDIITDSTLIIENFYPLVGITPDPGLINISVDIVDNTYDVDESALYLSVNGTTVSSTVTSFYGNRALTTVVSGMVSISGTSLDDAVLSGVTIVGTSIAGGIPLVTDGDMETAGVGAWIAKDATLTKEITNPYEGTQLLRVTGDELAWAQQTLPVTAGQKYRLRGWSRSDGFNQSVYLVGSLWIDATTSTSWQEQDTIFTWAGAPLLLLGFDDDPGYVEFDAVSVTEEPEAETECIGGQLLVGSGSRGLITNFPAPFDLTLSGELISAYFYEGAVISGSVDTALVAGVNWDGNTTNST